ncbi:MAG: PKD domain-containing protein [Parcubacteria group bacterium]|nr:PKD domain-containing protein [Parcubacteria group bacterium]
MRQIKNKIRSALLAFVLLAIPSFALAATDLGINASGVWLSKPFSKIEVNQDVRIYARAENFSDEDTIAEVEFYIGDALLGTRSITVLAKETGVAFWDWKTPLDPHEFALTVRVHRQLGGDQNPNNDEVTVYGLWVNSDTDADQVYNRVDNCPLIVNTEQEDADKDGIGDACEEKPVLAPAPAAPAQPTQTSTTTTPATAPAVTNTPQAPAKPAQAKTTPAVANTAIAVAPETSQEQAVPVAGELVELAQTVTTQTSATDTDEQAGEQNEIFIQSEQLSWNQFRFRPSSRLGGGEYVYLWDLGDGTTSPDRVVEHQYAGPGRYHVSVQLFDTAGRAQAATTLIHVGFFNLANWRLWILIGLLALIIIVSAVTAGVKDAVPAPGNGVDEPTDKLEPAPVAAFEPEVPAETPPIAEALPAAVSAAILSLEEKPTPKAAVRKPRTTKKPAPKKKPGKKRTITVKKLS